MRRPITPRTGGRSAIKHPKNSKTSSSTCSQVPVKSLREELKQKHEQWVMVRSDVATNLDNTKRIHAILHSSVQDQLLY